MNELQIRNKVLFEAYQNLFLILANSHEGRYLLGIKNQLPIIKLTPNSYILDTGEKHKGLPLLQGTFFCYEKMAKVLLPYLMAYDELRKKPVGTHEAIEFFGSQNGLYRSRNFPQVLLDSGQFFTSAGDGAVWNALPAVNTWSTCRSSADGNTVFATDTQASLVAAFPFVNSPYLGRMFFPTDTSAIGDGATIVSAVLSAYVVSNSNGSSFNVAVCQMQGASTTTLANGDFDGYDSLNSPTEWITRVSGNLTGSQYADFTYNSSGRSAINKTGFTYNGMRTSRDIDNSAPPDNPGTGDVIFNLSESSNDPYLTVTFSGVSASASNSPSPSSSQSPSSSISRSPSLSPSPSPSPSPSVSVSLSISRSPSSSLSGSSSISLSISLSPSSSLSPSPSEGFSLYTRGDEGSLPTNTDDLEITYTDDEETKVSTRNDTYVGQTGTLEYMLHQFKTFVGSATKCTISWEGKSELAPSLSTVYLQIFNTNTNTWETIDSNDDAPANVDFELEKKIKNLANYKNASNVITTRVYQLAI